MGLCMPKVGGIEATRQIREAPRVLLVTTFDQEEKVVVALQAGAAHL